MILSDDDLKRRLNNPLNLLNKPKGVGKINSAMSLFVKPSIEEKKNDSSVSPALVPSRIVNPFEKPKQEIPVEASKEPGTDELIADADAKVNLAIAHNNAIDVMKTAIGRVKNGIDDLDIRKLPGVITAMSKVVTEIQRTKLEHEKVNKGAEVHHIFYMPEQKKIDAYEVIDVSS